MQRLSTRRRAPAPMLSSEHLYQARSAPDSDAGTRSSGFLTPPVSGPRSMSPPPKVADDYLNVHGHRRTKRRHVGKQARKHYNTREEPGVSSYGLRSPTSATRSASGRCGSCGASTVASDGDSSSDSPLVKHVDHLKLNTSVRDFQDIRGNGLVDVQTWSTITSSVDEAREPQSPAMKALQSLARPSSSNPGKQTLRRMSTALAAAFGYLRSMAGASDSSETPRTKAKRPEALQERNAHRHNSIDRSRGPSRRTTLKDGKDMSGMLGIPATITLRKASNMSTPTPVICSMNASLLNECILNSDTSASASELLAFYSTPAVASENPKTVNGTNLESVSPSSGVTTEPSHNPGYLSQSARKRSMSMAQFKNGRRCSNPAEAIITFADVQVAPGSFTVEPSSRKASPVSTECLRRISVVQFHSRNSVHEVIWREDETTSGSSFASDSTSPLRQGYFSRSSTLGPEGENGSKKKLGTTNKDRNGSSSGATVSMPGIGRPEEGLLQWSWGEPSPSAGNAASDFPKPGFLPSTSDSMLATRRESSAQHARGGFYASESYSVESFPPLRDRSSTSEWRRAPLIDPYNPLAGRTQQYQQQENTYFAGPGAGIPRMPSFGTAIETSSLHHM